jgi:hypothetical protein
MGHYWTGNSHWTAYFYVNCEYCNRPFSFSQNYVTGYGEYDKGSRSGTQESAEKGLTGKIVSEQQNLKSYYGTGGILEFFNKKVDVHSCPECGYIQSWMVKRVKNQKNRYRKYMWLSGVLLFFMLFPFIGSLNSPEALGLAANLIIQVLTAGLLIGLLFSIYKSNQFNRTFDPNATITLNQHNRLIQKKPPIVKFSTDYDQYVPWPSNYACKVCGAQVLPGQTHCGTCGRVLEWGK